jgi:putative ABC transport system permease protein
MLDSLRRDIRHAVAALRNAPGFSLVAFLTIALATGATTTMFSVVDTLLIRPLPYPASDRLVSIFESSPALARLSPTTPVNADHFLEWRRTSRSFEVLALIGATTVNLTGAGDAERLVLGRVSPDFFRLVGATPQLGRLLRQDEDAPSRDRVLVISDALWRSRFGADTSIIGRTVDIDGTPYMVVGVLAPRLRLPTLASLSPMTVQSDEPQLWKPFGLTEAERATFGDFNYAAIGRLRRGVTRQQAHAELESLQTAYATRVLGGEVELHAALVPLQQQVTGRSRQGLILAMAAVVAVWLLAYTNVANLLLARAVARARDFSVRAALGASRWHLIRQTLMETSLLSGAGALAGIALAQLGVRALSVVAPASLPFRNDFTVDVRVLVMTVCMTATAGLAIGVLFAWRLGRSEARLALGSNRLTDNPAVGRTRSLFAIAEVAMTMVCLVAAGLLLQSWTTVLAVDKGFSTNGIGVVDLTLPAGRYPPGPPRVQFIRSVLDAVEQVPGVSSAALSNKLPLTGEGGNNAILREGMPPDPLAIPIADVRTVSPAFFRTLGVQLQAGRLFTDADGERRVATVSATTAARLWPGQNAIGRQFRIGLPTAPLIEVVGIVGDVRGASLEQTPALTVYVPYWQRPINPARLSLAIRTTDSLRLTAGAVIAAIHRVDPAVGVPPVRTMDDLLDESVSLRSFQTLLVAAFGAAAVLLAALGIYGVLAHGVSQRTREIGVRIALGARQERVLWLVARHALGLLAAGLVVGLPPALALAEALRSLLFGVQPHDPGTFVTVALAIAAVTVVAALAPAVRAARVDPIVALRNE